MQEKKEALRLIEETLKELESLKGSVLISVQKLSRVASILDNQDVYIWCEIQLGNPKYTNTLKQYIDCVLQYQKEKTDDSLKATNRIIDKLIELNLKSEIHYTNEELNIKKDINGGGYENIGFVEETYNDLLRLKKGNDGSFYKTHLNTHISYVKNKAHKIASQLFKQLKFSGTVSNSFDILKNVVDDRLLDLDPKISEQLMLAFKSVSSNRKEEWSQALTSCRRLLESLADKLLPASDEKINGRVLKQGQYVNRLWAFMDRSIESDTNKALAKTHIDFLGSWLEKVNKLANKGVHADLNQIEAVKAVFHTYLVVADILEYVNKKEAKTTKPNINEASLDELEVHLDISRTIAKEIFRLRIKEEYIDLNILSSIKGIGEKTIQKAKENFIIEE
ncbi:MAG: FIG00640624: hypothetical protein [uncultured Sulfurovum sp.]|uniref:Helix-hairpin-helix domain-containing protein n=1 Tax=uncultured Sulfurovum sp. TaxID=269237 RepID=A0A6S6S5L0_9BACT|nr:MAG: FIG00640624: hypothetical protein [uncultured Sulfurovum sp.]